MVAKRRLRGSDALELVSVSHSLSFGPLEDDRLHVQSLQAEVDRREAGLTEIKLELQQLQGRYLEQLGSLYAELAALEADVADAEIRAGLRPPPLFDEEEAGDDGAESAGPSPDSLAGSCSNRSAPSRDLRRMFRDLAKAVHPDRAPDDRARYRRHSLMAEANRAYAERDEDRLRLILRAWERSPESVFGDDDESESLRIKRRIAELEERLVAIDAEIHELSSSAIARLKRKIDEARTQGWDLFAEMIAQVRRELARAQGRLASLGRRPGQDKA
jgi:hypothetical protein